MPIVYSQHDKFTKALEYEKAGDYMMALQEYATLSHSEEPFRPALINLGSLFSRMNRLDDAMNCYCKASEMEEDYVTWFNIGSIHYKKEEYKKAVIALEKAKRINSSFVLPVLVTGLAYSRLGNVKAAEKSFKDVLRNAPANEVAMTALAILYYETGKMNQALEMIDGLLSLKPHHGSVRKLRSKILYNLGRIAESADDIKHLSNAEEGFTVFNKFVQSIPVEVFDDGYGTLDVKVEQLESKTEDKKNPGDMIALSLCYLFKGDTDKAVEVLYRAKEYQ